MEAGWENSTLTEHTEGKRSRWKPRVIYPMSLFIWTTEQGTKRIGWRQKLLKAKKDRKLWISMVAYVLT